MAYALASPVVPHLFYLSPEKIKELNLHSPNVVDAGNDPIAAYTPVKPADDE